MRTYVIRAKKDEDLRNPATLRNHMTRLEKLAAMPKKPSCSLSVEKLETIIRVLEDWVHMEHGAKIGGDKSYDMEPDDYEEFKLAQQLKRQVRRAKARFESKS